MTVELPKDAEGREIPLDTVVLYDKEGKRREVDWYTFYPDKDRWDVVLADSSAHFSPNNLSLTQPDSWEKLEMTWARLRTIREKSSARISIEKEMTAMAANSRAANAPVRMPS